MDFGRLGKFALGCIIYGLEDAGYDEVAEDVVSVLDSVSDLNQSIQYISSNVKKKKKHKNKNKKKSNKNECKKLFKNKDYK